MPTLLGSILKKVNRNNNKLNILTVNENEGFQDNLAKTNHNFFFLSHPHIRNWNRNIRDIPSNVHILLDQDINYQIKYDMQFDLILCQNRQTHCTLLSQVANKLGIPLICVDYNLMPPKTNQFYQEALADQICNHKIFINEFTANHWGFSYEEDDVSIIHHGVDTNKFKGWHGKDKPIMTMIRNYNNKNNIYRFDIVQQLSQAFNISTYGESTNFSNNINGLDNLIKIYQEHKIFLNTIQWHSTPLAMIEAMSVGCPIVTVKNPGSEEFLKDGYNACVSNDINDLYNYISRILNDQNFANYLSKNARKTIVDHYNINDFIGKWNNVFHTINNQASALITENSL